VENVCGTTRRIGLLHFFCTTSLLSGGVGLFFCTFCFFQRCAHLRMQSNLFFFDVSQSLCEGRDCRKGCGSRVTWSMSQVCPSSTYLASTTSCMRHSASTHHPARIDHGPTGTLPTALVLSLLDNPPVLGYNRPHLLYHRLTFEET
jgi:hypothetical protein